MKVLLLLLLVVAVYSTEVACPANGTEAGFDTNSNTNGLARINQSCIKFRSLMKTAISNDRVANILNPYIEKLKKLEDICEGFSGSTSGGAGAGQRRRHRQADGVIETIIDVALDGFAKISEIQEAMSNLPSVSFS